MGDEQLALDVASPSVSRGALLSDDGLYRYNLWRRWGDGLLLGFCMLNPSIADADIDDHTITRCCFYAKREGFSGIYVVNLYAFRATKPADLWRFGGNVGVGPENDQHIGAAILNQRIGMWIAAWGALPPFAQHRQVKVRSMFADTGVAMSCLGLTAKGWPRHPARLANSTTIEPFPAPKLRSW